MITYLVYGGWSLIAEYNAAGQLIQKYIHHVMPAPNVTGGPAIDELLSKTDANGTVYYHHDGLGSAVALTDATGNLVERYTYDVFGAPTLYNASGSVISVSSVANRFCFTGREGDPQTGLYDYRNRVYSSSLGRFLQTDPIRFDAGDGNLYRYVGNRVTFQFDPYGLREWGWPINGSVSNHSENPVQVLVGGDYQQVDPGNSTPDSIFNSQDVDGVWSDGNFYPVGAGENLNIGEDGKPTDPNKKPWDGESDEGSPKSRGATNNKPPCEQ